jgi:hypothetical protein
LEGWVDDKREEANIQMCRLTDGWTEGQWDRKTEGLTYIQMKRLKDNQQTSSQTHTDTNTDSKSNTHTHTHTHKPSLRKDDEETSSQTLGADTNIDRSMTHTHTRTHRE